MEVKLTSQVGQNRLLLHEAVPLETPLVIYVEPSGFCNLKCGFCPHGTASSGLKKAMMPVDLFCKMIDEIEKFPKKIKMMRVCGNGEPLINPCLVDMLSYASLKMVAEKTELITNAVLLTPELIEQLPRHLTRIVCSIEGLSDDEYLRICGTRVDFSALIRNIDALYTTRGDCILHVKINHEAVTSSEKEARFFALFKDKCDEMFIEKIVPMWPQMETTFSVNEFRWGDEAITPRRVCAQIFKGVQVQADGEVVPCCVDWSRVNVIGNLYESSLPEIWRSKSLRKLQLAHLSGEKGSLDPCKGCCMNDYCEVDNLDDYADECIRRLTQWENL